jgi:hypothetical protein
MSVAYDLLTAYIRITHVVKKWAWSKKPAAKFFHLDAAFEAQSEATQCVQGHPVGTCITHQYRI